MSRSIVTDHALLRWLERVKGYDVQGWRLELAQHVAPYAHAGVARWAAPEASYYFGQRRLVTVLRPGERVVPKYMEQVRADDVGGRTG